MKIGHGSKPQPLRSEIGTRRPATANVGMARLSVTIHDTDTSPRRVCASHEASGTMVMVATTTTMAHRMTVSASDARMPLVPVQLSGSSSHSKTPISRGTGACASTVTVRSPCAGPKE